MISTPIRATDEITVPFPVADVWPVLADVGAYPRWWPRSLGIRVISGGTSLVGTEMEVRPAGGRPFLCRIETVETHKRIGLRYFGRFIDGCGEWALQPQGRGTRVSYRIDATAQGWLVLLIGKVIDLAGLHSRSMRHVLAHLEFELARHGRSVRDGR